MNLIRTRNKKAFYLWIMSVKNFLRKYLCFCCIPKEEDKIDIQHLTYDYAQNNPITRPVYTRHDIIGRTTGKKNDSMNTNPLYYGNGDLYDNDELIYSKDTYDM